MNREAHSPSQSATRRGGETELVSAAGAAAPPGLVAYYMLVPRRQTGTDWKYKPGHPDPSHPKTTSSIITS